MPGDFVMTDAPNSAVEAVAKAISKYTWALLSQHDAGDCGEWEEMSETARNVYLQASRAAIAAMPAASEGEGVAEAFLRLCEEIGIPATNAA
jgi:hypothetical protein